MGKLKEKLLNNLDESQMEDIFGISAFEYVELMSKYKDDESYIPTEGEVEDIEKLVEDYYQSKEFRDYVEKLDIDEINDSVKLKYTDNDILYVLSGLAGPILTGMILDKLRDVWNTKSGVE